MNQPRTSFRRHRAAFSLIEVMVVLFIAAIFVVVVSNFSNNASDLNGLIALNLRARSDVSQTLQIINSEIRSAEPSAAGAYPIETAATGTFVFFADINHDGAPDRIQYFYASSTLWRGVIAPVGSPATYPTSSETVNDMVDNVIPVSSTPIFSYYDDSYTGSGPSLPTPVIVSAVRLVGITFDTVASSPGQPTSTIFFSTVVGIRNVNLNY